MSNDLALNGGFFVGEISVIFQGNLGRGEIL